jgi:hypothetical protein
LNRRASNRSSPLVIPAPIVIPAKAGIYAAKAVPPRSDVAPHAPPRPQVLRARQLGEVVEADRNGQMVLAETWLGDGEHAAHPAGKASARASRAGSNSLPTAERKTWNVLSANDTCPIATRRD